MQSGDEVKAVLAKRLSEVRKDRGLTLDQLGELTGLSKAYLCEMEHGDKNPTLEVLAKVSAALQVTAASLLEEESERM
jgi:XRE family transcriptional regulator, regulator of sulfur utilization